MRDINIYALDSQLNMIAILKPTNIQWSRKYYENGYFSILLPLEQYSKEIAYIYTPDRPETGRVTQINYISEGDYTFEESVYYCSGEMLKKVFNDSDLLEFALDKLLYMTKEELIERYKKNKISEQDLEDIKRCCDNFKSYCSSRFCDNCDIHKFKKENGLNGLGLGTEICMLIYGYLFEKEGE